MRQGCSRLFVARKNHDQRKRHDGEGNEPANVVYSWIV